MFNVVFKALSDVADVIDPHPSHRAPKAQQVGIPFVGIGDFDSKGKINFSKARTVDHKVYEEHKGRYSLEDNLLAFGRVASIGKVVRLPKPTSIYTVSPTLAILRPTDIDIGYLEYALQSPDFMKQMNEMSTGSTRKSVGIQNLRKAKLPVLALPQQKRIVAILDKAFAAVDEAKAKTEQNLKNARELFESEKAEVFGKLSNKFYEKKIAEVCEEIFAGGDAPKHSLSKIKTDEFKIPIYANAVKDQGLYGFTEKARVLKPSVTVAARGSGTGHVEVRKAEFFPIVRLIVLTPNPDKMNVDFLYYAIKNLNILRSGSAIPQLTVPMMRSYSIPVPDISTQVEIIHRFRKSKSHIDSLIENYNSKLELLGELRKSLLQKAFSGELTAKQAEEVVA